MANCGSAERIGFVPEIPRTKCQFLGTSVTLQYLVVALLLGPVEMFTLLAIEKLLWYAIV